MNFDSGGFSNLPVFLFDSEDLVEIVVVVVAVAVAVGFVENPTFYLLHHQMLW